MTGAALPPAVGFVVAGGRSRRMGRDKALLAWGGATLLDHALARLAEVCGEVRILSGAERRYLERGVPVDVDAIADAGPLAALAAGLERAGERPALFLGVDLPLVPGRLLRHLLEAAHDRDAVVPVSARGPEPLCAVYRRACLDAIRRRLAQGERKMTCFWPDVRVLEWADFAAFGDPEALFRNVNTPEDYRSLTER